MVNCLGAEVMGVSGLVQDLAKILRGQVVDPFVSDLLDPPRSVSLLIRSLTAREPAGPLRHDLPDGREDPFLFSRNKPALSSFGFQSFVDLPGGCLRSHLRPLKRGAFFTIHRRKAGVSLYVILFSEKPPNSGFLVN